MDKNVNGLGFRVETPKEDKTTKYNLDDKQTLFGDSHLVHAEIGISSGKVLDNISYKLEIEQNTLDRTSLSIQCLHEAFEDYGADPLDKSKKLMGEKMTIQSKQQ